MSTPNSATPPVFKPRIMPRNPIVYLLVALMILTMALAGLCADDLPSMASIVDTGNPDGGETEIW